jgi:hypothetical protein
MPERETTSRRAALFGIAGVLVLGVVGWLALQDAPRPRKESDTLCNANGANDQSTLTVIIVDRSEPFNEIQQQDILRALRRVITESAEGDEFQLFEMKAQRELSTTPVLRGCNPGGVKADTMREKLDQTALSRRVFEEKFVARINSAIEETINVPPLADSPLMEMIQGVTVVALKRANQKTRRLILVSDLMQHSSNYSQYAVATYDWTRFRESPAFKALSIDLSSTQVRALYVARATGASAQKPGHKEFWTKYFDALNAKTIVFDEIEGAAWQAK